MEARQLTKPSQGCPRTQEISTRHTKGRRAPRSPWVPLRKPPPFSWGNSAREPAKVPAARGGFERSCPPWQAAARAHSCSFLLSCTPQRI